MQFLRGQCAISLGHDHSHRGRAQDISISVISVSPQLLPAIPDARRCHGQNKRHLIAHPYKLLAQQHRHIVDLQVASDLQAHLHILRHRRTVARRGNLEIRLLLQKPFATFGQCSYHQRGRSNLGNRMALRVVRLGSKQAITYQQPTDRRTRQWLLGGSGGLGKLLPGQEGSSFHIAG